MARKLSPSNCQGFVSSRFIAKVAVTNAILHVPALLDERHITWAIFTDPELAHAGRSEEELKDHGVEYSVYGLLNDPPVPDLCSRKTAARPTSTLGTWRIVFDQKEMSRIPRDFAGLISLLKSRHARIMEGRPEKAPGRFKADPNRAGSTTFVAPDLVEGTLAKGFEIYRGLTSPLHRAILMMFLISEVHPFIDGNGRAARIMMNAELVAAGENRIIVPTVYRNNYLMALKALSQNRVAGALVRVMDFAQRYTAAIDFSDFDRARAILEKTHAFADSNEADAAGIRLLLPTPEMLADPPKR